MPVELPYVNDTVQKPEEPSQPVRKPEAEIFTQPKPNVDMEIKPSGFPQTQKPPDAIPLEKKKGKPRGVKDPEARKAHMEKMRKASAESRARKKAEKSKGKQPLQTIPENKPLEIQGGLPEGFSGHKPEPITPPNTPVNNPVHSQPVEADQLRKRLQELEKQNTAYKTWYKQNRHILNQIPPQENHVKPPPSQPINIPQPQVSQQNHVNAGLERLSSLEKMIRKDERDKMLAQQKLEREEQAKNLRSNVRMPKGLQKWQSVNNSKTYKSNEDMWADCFNPR